MINNFNGLDSRNDVGALWENFAAAERMKHREYSGIYCAQYFWRTYDGSEVDLVEERDGKLYGYEFKVKAGSRARVPSKWTEAVRGSYAVLTPENIADFVY